MPCWRCGLPIIDGVSQWDVGHLVDRAAGGSNDRSNTRPEHATCNRSSGGKRGAAITNQRTRGSSTRGHMKPERDRGITGI